MTSADSAWLSFFASLAFAGTVVVIVGVVLEGSELFVKWASKKKFRVWVETVFGRERRRWIVLAARNVKPRILPFESAGFAVLVIGLGIELLGGFGAERMQSKQNSVLTLEAAKIGTTNAQLVADNLVLGSNVLVLKIELRKMQMPWFIPPDKIETAEAILRPFSGTIVHVVSVLGDVKSEMFSNELRGFLRHCNWVIPEDSSGATLAPTPNGVIVFVNRESDGWAGNCLQRFFGSIGIAASLQKAAQWNTNNIVIIIGVK